MVLKMNSGQESKISRRKVDTKRCARNGMVAREGVCGGGGGGGELRNERSLRCSHGHR